MKDFLLGLFDTIYKKKCYFCGNSKESIKMCSECYGELEYLPAEINRQFNGIRIYCAGAYESALQKLIRGLKYHKQRDLAYFQAKFMYEYWKKLSDNKEYQIVPVPLYLTREKARKYNHMALVGEEFSKLSGFELNLDLVKRVKDTKPQYNLNKNQRMENLSNAFKIDKSKLLGGDILLLDDICTTGSTFENIVVELSKEGLNNVVCFATTTPFLNNEVKK